MPPARDGGDGRLLRLLGVAFGLAVTVGGTIGVGILRTPALVAAQLPDAGLILAAWTLGGGYALVGTLVVVELGAALPSAGGWYVYARRAFGDAAGFAVGWSDWLAQCGALAYLAVSIGDFSAALQPALAPAAKALALLTLAGFAAIQWLGLRESSWVQEATSLVKGLALLGFVAACFVLSPAGAPGRPTSPAAAGLGALSLAGAVIALQSVIITYDGWYTAIYFTEEDVDPGRNLPRSALGGVAVTIGIYMLVNLALLRVLNVQELASAGLAAAEAGQAVFGGAGRPIVTALSLVSLLSVINAVLMLATRILFAVARDGLFAASAAGVSATGTPTAAMLLTSLVSAGLVLSGTFAELVAITSVLLVLVYSAGFVALFVLRRSEPDLARPFRVPGYPWLPLLALVGSAAFLVGNVIGDPRSSVWAVVMLAASYLPYRFFARTRRGADRAAAG